MLYTAANDRYSVQPYRRCGRSGGPLPAISLGFWHNFGDDKPLETQRAVIRRPSFDLGVTHFDLADNYGPPDGPPRATQDTSWPKTSPATARSWSSPPRQVGRCGRVRTVTTARGSTLPQVSMGRCAVWGWTMSTFTITTARSGHAAGRDDGCPGFPRPGRKGPVHRCFVILPKRTARATEILRALGNPLLIHQPSYSMFNRWIESELLDVLDREGVGCIAFTALAQGLLTNRYLNGVPADSRAAQGKSLEPSSIEANLGKINALNEIAAGCGQTLAQLALPGCP